MRVLLVHATPLDHQGGAEISLRQHVQHAPAGVFVETAFPEDAVDLNRFDAIVLGNLRPTAPARSAPHSQLRNWVWKRVSQSPFEALAWRNEIAAAKLWCRRLRRYQGRVIRSERDVHPCGRRTGACLATNPLERLPCECGTAVPSIFEELYNLCHAIHFLSPLHRQAINQLIRIDVPQFEIAVPLDFSRFRPLTPLQDRQPLALATGDAIRVSGEEEKVASRHGYTLEWVDYHSVPYEKMPALLNRFRAVILQPVMLHAFGRLAAEALACGCEVLANSRVGAMSWPDPLQACREANSRFWQMVTGSSSLALSAHVGQAILSPAAPEGRPQDRLPHNPS